MTPLMNVLFDRKFDRKSDICWTHVARMSVSCPPLTTKKEILIWIWFSVSEYPRLDEAFVCVFSV